MVVSLLRADKEISGISFDVKIELIAETFT
jgi:hypothetical protein